MCALRVTMVNDAILVNVWIDLLNSYVFRDLDRQNLQWLLDYWSNLFHGVVTTMLPYRVTMVVRSWVSATPLTGSWTWWDWSTTVIWPVCGLLGRVRHAAYGIVDLLSWRPYVALSHNGPYEKNISSCWKIFPRIKGIVHELSNYQFILTILYPVILWFSMSSG